MCTGIMKAIGFLIISSLVLIVVFAICQAAIRSLNAVVCPERESSASRADKAKEEQRKESAATNGHTAGVGTL